MPTIILGYALEEQLSPPWIGPGQTPTEAFNAAQLDCDLYNKMVKDGIATMGAVMTLVRVNEQPIELNSAGTGVQVARDKVVPASPAVVHLPVQRPWPIRRRKVTPLPGYQGPLTAARIGVGLPVYVWLMERLEGLGLAEPDEYVEREDYFGDRGIVAVKITPNLLHYVRTWEANIVTPPWQVPGFPPLTAVTYEEVSQYDWRPPFASWLRSWVDYALRTERAGLPLYLFVMSS